ncbi:MAG: DUF4186 family protein [Dehalococcoidia bacterium]
MASLRHEFIRHHFWHVDIDQRAINHALRKGRSGLSSGVIKRIAESVGTPPHPREGRQTPWKGNVIYYAQHAVAACCRRCIEQWHGIPREEPLTTTEIEYLAELVWCFIDERVPELDQEGVYVPRLIGSSV